MITVLENLVHTEGVRDIEIAGDERGMYAYATTGDISLLETGKTYTYSITFRGKKVVTHILALMEILQVPE